MKQAIFIALILVVIIQHFSIKTISKEFRLFKDASNKRITLIEKNVDSSFRYIFEEANEN